LQKENSELRALVAQLRDEIARLKKNSSNSSKPPSSDIVKPPKSALPRGKKRRRIGGQPGHPRQSREPFGPDDIDTIQTYTLESCPTCGGAVRPAKRPPRVLQQVEIPAIPLEVTEHRGLAYWCPRCQKLHYAPLPADVRRAGLVGPRLTALVAYLKGSCHASYSTIRAFCRDVLKQNRSRGQLAKLVARSSEAMADAF
ncbi:MAG: IS66 family transposase zinc-finger binding domain-containing protein, partial [Phycisphaerae bacterium]|nr:IS66 family transposase zinc-finger binding domain-containing protein [Phycisphaerae bacterium]